MLLLFTNAKSYTGFKRYNVVVIYTKADTGSHSVVFIFNSDLSAYATLDEATMIPSTAAAANATFV